MGRTVLTFEGINNYFAKLASRLNDIDDEAKDFLKAEYENLGKEIDDDTKEALKKANLPAGGVYSMGKTKEAVINQPKAEWSGTVLEMGYGFNRKKPNAGSYLITGTPKMKPVKELEDIYARQTYFKTKKRKIKKDFDNFIKEKWGDNNGN